MNSEILDFSLLMYARFSNHLQLITVFLQLTANLHLACNSICLHSINNQWRELSA